MLKGTSGVGVCGSTGPFVGTGVVALPVGSGPTTGIPFEPVAAGGPAFVPVGPVVGMPSIGALVPSGPELGEEPVGAGVSIPSLPMSSLQAKSAMQASGMKARAHCKAARGPRLRNDGLSLVHLMSGFLLSNLSAVAPNAEVT
jgi:hypothetical protein